MTAPDVDALEAARAAATPGPWHVEQHSVLEKGCRCLSCWELVDAWDIREVDGPDCAEHGCWHNISLNEHDAALIVAAVNNLDALLAAVRERDALRAAVEGLAEEWVGSSALGLSALAGAGRELRRLLAAVDGGQRGGEEEPGWVHDPDDTCTCTRCGPTLPVGDRGQR